MKDIIQRMWPRRWFKVCVWVIGAICLIVPPLMTGLLIRLAIRSSGSGRWAAVQEMLAREGESIDIRKIAPDPVPDDRNFFAIPALKDLAISPVGDDDTNDLTRNRLRLVHTFPQHYNSNAGPRPNAMQGVDFGKETHFKPWVDWMREDGPLPPPESGDPAMDVLAALSRNDTIVRELALGLNRPESQWTPAWKTRVLPENLFTVAVPQYMVTQALTPMLWLRCAAAASVGDAAKAQESLLIAVRLNQAYVREPILIGTLVLCGSVSFIDEGVWELCDTHSGTAEDFRKLQEGLSKLDFRAALLCAERGEMAGGAEFMDYFKRTRDPNFFELVETGTDDPAMRTVMRLIPGGWFDANEATLAKWHFDYEIKPLRDAGLMAMLARQDDLQALLTDHRSHPYEHLDELLAQISLPATRGVVHRVVYAQSILNEAVAACALERYRIEHGAYPETLAAANHPGEKSIPADIISGKPIGYRKTAHGQYALWCVGFTGIDHGGKRVLDPKTPESTRFSDPAYAGDWVWDFPPG